MSDNDIEFLIASLDRCEHGRHQRDDCWGCPDGNKGNPHADAVIGYSLGGVPITSRELHTAYRLMKSGKRYG